MKILAVGGGSGGHVTPVAAVLKEIAADQRIDTLEALFVCDKAFEKQSRGLMARLPFSVAIKTIPSGKLRRYAHFSWWQYVVHPSIVLHNIVDTFKTASGFFASLWLIARFRPDVVFAKGGYVCLPVGIAAHFLRIPLIIHDSDVRPGLTNKVLARFASAIGTGMPLENYSYNKAIARYVGVPINPDITPTTPEKKDLYRKELGISPEDRLIVSVGGGLGSVIINSAMIAAAKQFDASDHVTFFNVTGIKNFETVQPQVEAISFYKAVPFVYEGMHKLLAAADIVITRASATTLQELAGLKQTVVAVPAKQLGDQNKNAELFERHDAVEVLHDDTLEQELSVVIKRLLDDSERRTALAANLHAFARPNAARDMASMIIEEVKTK